MMKTDAPKRIRILIVDDYAVVREGLLTIINGQPDMSVVAEGRNGEEAIEMFRQHRPDVTLMDLHMPIMKGADAIEAIRREFPRSRIIVFTGSGSDEDIYQALSVGVQSYLWKSMPREQLLDAIRIVHSGGRKMPAPIARVFSERVPQLDLTVRELEILELIVNGKSNKRIATALRITEGTVKAHVGNIMRKLDADDRTQAAMTALRRGIIGFEQCCPTDLSLSCVATSSSLSDRKQSKVSSTRASVKS
jgi:two-component system NarL family response regulator